MRLFDPVRDDVAALAALHAACFAKAWDGAALAGLLSAPASFAVFAPDGFILAQAAGGEAEILTLAVAPAARGRGLGRALVTAAARHAATMGANALFLEVEEGNAPALALYAGLGFLQVGRRTGYYEGRDARLLKAVLPLSPAADFA